MSTKRPDWLADYGMTPEVLAPLTEEEKEVLLGKEGDKPEGVIISSSASQHSNFMSQATDAERYAIMQMQLMSPLMNSAGEIVIDSIEKWEKIMSPEEPEERAARLKEAQFQSTQFLNRINRKRRKR